MAFEPTSGTVLAEKYRLVRRLAGGGMGSVWLARHLTLDADVAVKLMAPELVGTQAARSRFEREAKACAQLKSPHVIRVFDFGLHEGVPFMVMELLAGEDLAARLERVGALTLPEVCTLARQLAKALRVAHEVGIVHRDLKPSNVFFATEGDDEIVKLVDFGVARETRTLLVDDPTSSGVVVGSPHHMSPEQARGEKVGPKSDLWSLGVLLFRALTGAKLFGGDNLTAVLLAVVSDPIPSVTSVRPGLPPALDRVFARVLVRDVDARESDPSLLALAIERVAEGRDPDEVFARVESSAPDTEPTVAPGVAAGVADDIATVEDTLAAQRVSVGHSAVAPISRTAVSPALRPPRTRAWTLIVAALLVTAVAASIAFFAGALDAPGASSARASAPVPSEVGGSAERDAPRITPSVAEAHGSTSSPTGTGPVGSAPSAASGPASASLRPSAVRPGAPSTAKPCTKIDSFTGLCVGP